MGGTIAGQVKSGGGLSFITVNDAGHQVPMDQPVNVRMSHKFMITEYIKLIAT